jgi:DNA polymerase V
MIAIIPDSLIGPIPIAEVSAGFKLCIMEAAGAGFPSPAQDWEETAIDLVELLRLDRAASFVFRISGHSMVDAGIFDGDVVVVDRDAKPSNGRLVIAIVEDGFVIRQICIKGDTAYLEARNSRMSYPLTPVTEDIDIWGVVRASVRSFKS